MTRPETGPEDALDRCIARMRRAGVAEPAVAVFADQYRQCRRGVTGIIAEDSIRPLLDPPKLADVAVPDDRARAALAQTVIIKLNGGLGTSMGLDAAKTLLPVRDGRSFLDLIVQQVRHARHTHGVRLPLLFMNSFRTRQDTLAALARHGDLPVAGLPLDFLQHREPKLLAAGLRPVDWPADPELEWCPPGHGDIYPALWVSGLLDTLLAGGFRYASVANGDNLGAAPDAKLAGWFADSGAAYAAEICPRTPNDRKGGHLAVRGSDGRLVLRDTAQTSPADLKCFTDERVHPYFHANNLWLDLRRLRRLLAERAGNLRLPLIRNIKTVDPTDPASPQVIQLESAMGAAIEVFDDSRAIVVPRDRFLPVKTTNELLLVRSDVFELGDDGRLRSVVHPIPRVELDPRYYRLLSDFDDRIVVLPSLRAVTSLKVLGDWTFDAPAKLTGAVVLPDDGRAHRYPDER